MKMPGRPRRAAALKINLPASDAGKEAMLVPLVDTDQPDPGWGSGKVDRPRLWGFCPCCTTKSIHAIKRVFDEASSGEGALPGRLLPSVPMEDITHFTGTSRP